MQTRLMFFESFLGLRTEAVSFFLDQFLRETLRHLETHPRFPKMTWSKDKQPAGQCYVTKVKSAETRLNCLFLWPETEYIERLLDGSADGKGVIGQCVMECSAVEKVEVECTGRSKECGGGGGGRVQGERRKENTILNKKDESDKQIKRKSKFKCKKRNRCRSKESDWNGKWKQRKQC